MMVKKKGEQQPNDELKIAEAALETTAKKADIMQLRLDNMNLEAELSKLQEETSGSVVERLKKLLNAASEANAALQRQCNTWYDAKLLLTGEIARLGGELALAREEIKRWKRRSKR